MTIQIAVRLPDDVVSFLDEAVARGEAPSRAAVVIQALERERRERAAAEDARILTEIGPQDDLDNLVECTARTTHVED
ncbi:YlcI/YnfO family protein [Actinomyces gaoshouyii]|nr:YlcI/YnfO family protein [Actinomyces gaoshouyii]ARD41318.1 hypothetical protein B6G06_02115 [Actinomyces gaoshouyii]